MRDSKFKTWESLAWTAGHIWGWRSQIYPESILVWGALNVVTFVCNQLCEEEDVSGIIGIWKLGYTKNNRISMYYFCSEIIIYIASERNLLNIHYAVYKYIKVSKCQKTFASIILFVSGSKSNICNNWSPDIIFMSKTKEKVNVLDCSSQIISKNFFGTVS